MITFLLIMSILFNLVAFLAIYLLFMRQNRLIFKEEKHQRMLNEIEQTFTSHLVEMKEENEVFLKQFEHIQKTLSEKENNSGLQNKKAEEHKTNQNDEKENLISIVKTSKSIAANRYRKTQTNSQKKAQDHYDETLQQKVARMNNEGASVQQIAKSLQKGQTEIELMIKFQDEMK